MVTSVSSENGRILADHTEGLFSVIAWAVNVRNLLCLSHHRCVSAGVVCIATSCSLKSIKKKIILQRDLLNLKVRAGNTPERNLEKWKLINLSYTSTSLKRSPYFFLLIPSFLAAF